MEAPASILLLVSLVVLIFFSRPLLEAQRLSSSTFLVAGALLGPSIGGAVPAGLVARFEPILALAAGWLVLLAAESWDLDQLRRARGALPVALAGAAALAAAALPFVWPWFIHALTGAGDPTGMAATLVLLACVAAAVDADATRIAVLRAPRPAAEDRTAPLAATLVLGGSLLATSLASGIQTARAVDQTILSRVGPLHVGATLLLGLAVGLFYVGPIRLAQGRGPLLALILSLPLVGWGIARWLGMSPLALLFSAGIVLANDRTRRDLVFTLLRELQRPFTAIALLIAGAALPVASDLGQTIVFWLMAATFALGRPVMWRMFAPRGLPTRHALALSPLAILIAFEAGHWPGPASMPPALPPVLVAVAFVLGEAVWGFVWRPMQREETS